MSPWKLNRYALDILHGAVFAYPTDTIWGLGCHPLNHQAVTRILHIKKRPSSKGMILLASQIDYCRSFIDRDFFEHQYRNICTPESEPTTWLIPASLDCPGWLTGQARTVAIRLTHLPHIRALCDTIQQPLISTSANISGRKPASNIYQIQRIFSQQVDFVVTGFPQGSTQASRIIDLQSGKIIRG